MQIEETWRFDMAIKMMEALAYFHSKGYMHLDIKPPNIFMLTSFNPVLGDLGLANNKQRLYAYCGTPGYMDPEVEMARGAGGAYLD